MNGDMERLARALGWFSLGLGFAQIAAPAKVAQLIGVDDDDETIAVMRVLGVREIASGLGILTQPKPAPWLWARVGGDAMDLALLRTALSSPRADHNRVAAATAAVAGIAAVDALCSTRLTAEADAPHRTSDAAERRRPRQGGGHGQCPAHGGLRVLGGVPESAALHGRFRLRQISGDRRSRWRLTAPAGITLEWDVEISDATPQPADRLADRGRDRAQRVGRGALPHRSRASEARRSSSMRRSARRAASWARRSPVSLPRRWAPRSAVTCAASSSSSSWARSSTPTTASSRDPIRRNRRQPSQLESLNQQPPPETAPDPRSLPLRAADLAGRPPGDHDEGNMSGKVRTTSRSRRCRTRRSSTRATRS